MADLSTRVGLLATRIANYIRDSVLPRLIPSGGATGTVLGKSSATNYAVSWITPSAGAGAALDTLSELAAALGNDAGFASTVTTALGYRLRFDAAQALTTGQKTQACANLGIGEPDTDFVTKFNSGLV